MEMPIITGCAVDGCAYNQGLACHALAITVGDARHANCDTYLQAPTKGGDPSANGRVGACKMSDCRHNVGLECRATGITVGFHQSDIDCLTYAPA
ncbi:MULTISPECIES: DUF1540 domain-containing protein [unclassified Kitasatospora]|uniref:DUF1540 domain-containing protein n=1 Tax=unclassified Kitasatospora TaxID=2633591 RepID=UPI00340542D8